VRTVDRVDSRALIDHIEHREFLLRGELDAYRT
jgi:hypothetical protein